MNKKQSEVAALIFNSAHCAALSSDDHCPIEVGKVTFAPAVNDPRRFVHASIQIEWSTGPAWGNVRLEFVHMHYVRPGDITGVWKRAAGVAMLPGGLPMLPALSQALNEIANVALTAAEDHLPAGIVPETAAE
jgi:hypothetical protein